VPGPHPKGLAHSLALAVAAGRPVARWAKDHDISPRTAYGWTRRPGFAAKVGRLRLRIMDRAVGQLAAAAARNAATINKLATGAENENVRLAAARAALADLMQVRRHIELEQRVIDLERRLDGPVGGEGGPA